MASSSSALSVDLKYAHLSEEEGFYMGEMDLIYAKPGRGLCYMPAQLRSYLFVGGYREANNIPCLKKNGITHILNCAAVKHHKNNPYPPKSGVVEYAGFHGEDNDKYDLLQHLPQVQEFVRRCREYGGRVLIHCAVGVNRSATLCILYLMAEEGIDLVSAMEMLKEKRGTIVTNKHFRLQLVRFAKEKGLLCRK